MQQKYMYHVSHQSTLQPSPEKFEHVLEESIYNEIYN